MQCHQNVLKNRLYQVNQECFSYRTYEINTFTEIIDTVMNLNNKITAVKRELLNRTLYNDMGQVQIINAVSNIYVTGPHWGWHRYTR